MYRVPAFAAVLCSVLLTFVEDPSLGMGSFPFESFFLILSVFLWWWCLLSSFSSFSSTSHHGCRQ